MANDVKITTERSRNGLKDWYTLEWGKKAGQRKALGLYTWVKPKDQLQKNHNKEILKIVETKRSHLVLEAGSIGTGYVPAHKFKSNFLDYYSEYVTTHIISGNRHLQNSLTQFKKFLNRDHISPTEITKDLCELFRAYLLKKFNGSTPLDYFSRFKKCIEAATELGYFRIDPADKVKCKSNPTSDKDALDLFEYKNLINSHCPDYEVKKAAITSLYTGFRWCDVKKLEWWQIKENTIQLRKQSKTGVPLEIPLHPVVKAILGKRQNPNTRVFSLPSANGANKVLGQWVNNAGIDKHITWHCLRHTVSHILLDKKVDADTVAALLGQTSSKYVIQTYKKRVKKAHIKNAVKKLPTGSPTYS